MHAVAEGPPRKISLGSGEVQQAFDQNPLSPGRIAECQEIRNILGSPESSVAFGFYPAFRALRAAAFAENFTRTIAPDPKKEHILAVKFNVMKVLGNVEQARLAVDSPVRNDAMFNAAQERTYRLYPNIGEALLHPDTGVSYLSFEKVVAELNKIRPPMITLLDLAHFESVDDVARDQVLSLYYESHAQRAGAALQRVQEDRPQWMRRWVEKPRPDGSLQTVGEGIVDVTEERRTRLTRDLRGLLFLHESTLRELPPLTAADTLLILKNIRAGKYEAVDSDISQNDTQIAA